MITVKKEGLLFNKTQCEFENSKQFGVVLNSLVNNEELSKNMSLDGLHIITNKTLKNSAITHALLLTK